MVAPRLIPRLSRNAFRVARANHQLFIRQPMMARMASTTTGTGSIR